MTDSAAAAGDTAWLGVDVGTQGVRAVVVDGLGLQLGSGSAPLLHDHRDGDRHEQDPAEWWSAVCTATRAACSSLGDRSLGGMALDSTSGTVVVQDRNGRPRGPGVMYDDARATGQSVKVQRAGEAVWTSLGYRMQPTWALPKVVWLLAEGEVHAGDQVVHQADCIGARLTGGPVATDTSHALKTGYDPVTGDWPVDVLDSLGVAVGILPPVVLPGRRLGVVSDTAAAQSGVPAGTPLLAGMTDGCAAQIAARALRPGSWSSALGTTLVIKGSTPELVRDPTGAVYCHLNPDGGWLPGGASSIGAGILAEEFATADLAALTGRAAAAPLPRGVTYPLRGRGERFPFVAPAAHGFTEGAASGDVERFAAVLHGIALVERLAYAVLRSLGADTSGPVTLSGGATRNRWWNQMRADVLGRPALLPASVEAALGMAVLAAAAPGRLAETAEAMVAIAEQVDPDPARADEHDQAYERLCTALVRRGWLDAGLLEPAGPTGPTGPAATARSATAAG